MILESVTVSTRVAKAGMTVRQVFEECARANIPGLPFCDEHGLVTGRITVKNILKHHCLPEYLVDLASIMGEEISSAEDMETLARQLLRNPIDSCVQRPHASVSSGSSVIKALAMMENLDTGYLFVIDEGHYRGVITMQNLSRTILHYDD